MYDEQIIIQSYSEQQIISYIQISRKCGTPERTMGGHLHNVFETLSKPRC